MPHIHSRRRKPAIAALILLSALPLAACGSSSKSSAATSANATASTSASTTGAAKGATPGRFTAIRECLQKNGITPPKGTPGQPPSPGAGGFLGGPGGLHIPKGMTQTRYVAILKKCGGHFFGGGSRGRAPGIGTRLQSPAVTAALATFAACLRKNGVNVPAPNTSGSGPVFNTKGLNTTGTAFRTAEKKCISALQGAFRARPGAAGAPG